MSSSPELSQDRLLAGLPRDKKGRPVIGDCALVRKIGMGGMGSVYLARQDGLGRDVAVKILPFTLVEADPSMARRFTAEARLAAQLESDHVVRVFGAGHEHRTHFFVMQYVPGESAGGLIKRLKAEGKGGIPEEQALRIAIGAARGLAAAHAKGIVHRDVKPDNILIPDGDVDGAKLADLGLAKPEGSVQTFGTLSHVAMGTPGFMAPEQTEDAKNAGPPADVFAFGATFYAMVAGDPPFRGSSLVAVIRAALQEAPPPLPEETSPGVKWLIDKCLEKDPGARFRDGAELLAALLKVKKNPRMTMAKPRKIVDLTEGAPKSKAPLWIGIGVAALVLLAVGVVIAKKKGGGAEKAPEPVVEEAPKGDDAEALFAQAERLERDNRLDDALATLARAAAYAPDDPRLKESRARIEARQKSSRSASEKAEAWKLYSDAAGVARGAAETADTREAWEKVIEIAGKMGGAAQTPEEEAKVKALVGEATQRRLWALARAEEKAGRVAEALAKAKEAQAAGAKSEFLDAFVAALQRKLDEGGALAARKKAHDAAAAEARGESDAAKAKELWEKALALADDAEDKRRAEEGIRASADRTEGAGKDALFEAALKEAETAFGAGNLDLAGTKVNEALRYRADDARARELLGKVQAAQADKEWTDALAAIETAKKSGDAATLRLAYRKALSIKSDAALAKALADLERESLAVKPTVTDKRIEVVLDGGVKLEFVRVKPCTFTAGRGPEARQVTLTKEYAILTTEVTQDQWRALMDFNPSLLQKGNHPVECVTWWDAQDYCDRLSERLAGWTAALPTYAQWECAARAGSKSEFGAAETQAGISEFAWHGANSSGKSHEVATKKPNNWGLYDMQGNVFEFTWDWLGPVPEDKDLTDPAGPGGGTEKITCGGCFNHGIEWNIPGPRGPGKPIERHSDQGFRIILMKGDDPAPHLKRLSIPIDSRTKMEFVKVPAGEYTTGAPEAADPARKVVITDDYWIAVTETTQAQWESLMGKHPFTQRGPDLPVDNVSWTEAQHFLRKLGAKTGKLKPSLPTEAEWEYACRAGTGTHWQSGEQPSAAYAWHNMAVSAAQPVGKLRPNAWGLYDMHGNVREWCFDWHAPWAAAEAKDPHGPEKGTERVLRGGAWDQSHVSMASGTRERGAPDKRVPNAGFRVVLR